MDARLREALVEAVKVLGLEGVTVNIVIPNHIYLDVFHVACGLKEDGSGKPEGSFKNFGGDLGVHVIEEYIDANPGFEELVRELDLKDPETIQKLGGVAEAWQEGRFIISPRDIDKLFLALVRHVPDRDLGAQGVVHRDFFFGTQNRIFAEPPTLQTIEIYSSALLSIHDVERPDENGRVYVAVEYLTPEGEQVRRRVRVSPIHVDAIDITYKKIHGEKVSLPVISCEVVKRGGYCAFCKKRGEAKNAKRSGVDTLHIPRDKSASTFVPKHELGPAKIFEEEIWTLENKEPLIATPSSAEDARDKPVDMAHSKRGKPQLESDIPSDPQKANIAIRAMLENIRSRRRPSA